MNECKYRTEIFCFKLYPSKRSSFLKVLLDRMNDPSNQNLILVTN